MQLFLQVVLAYPTLPLSIVLTVCLLYWLLVAGGLLGDGLGLEAAMAWSSMPVPMAWPRCWPASVWAAHR